MPVSCVLSSRKLFLLSWTKIATSGAQSCLPEIEMSSFTMVPSSYKGGRTAVGVIGSKGSRSVPTGRSFQRSLQKHEIQPDNRGHVWYACAPEDMTEKVSPSPHPQSLLLGIYVFFSLALPRLEAMEDRSPRRRRRLARGRRADLGLIQ